MHGTLNTLRNNSCCPRNYRQTRLTLRKFANYNYKPNNIHAFCLGARRHDAKLPANKPARRPGINFRLLDTTGHPARTRFP